MIMIAVKILLEKFITLIGEETQLLGRVPQDLDALRNDFESMKSFLQDAEARSETDQGVRTWVKQVREVTYDAENVLEEFSLYLSPPQGHGFLHSLHKGYHYLMRLRTRRRLSVEIQKINEKVKNISQRRNAFSFKRTEIAASSSTDSVMMWHDPRLASLFTNECDLVGIETPKRVLISWLVGGNQDLAAISVVGMGGVGKTTLARKAYEGREVKAQFGSRAWIAISKSYTTVELLRAMMKDLLEEAKEIVPEGLHTTSELQLVNKLRDYLSGRRYLLVFDDVWDTKAWQIIKSALPECQRGSRIILTTRNGNVAESIDDQTRSHIYHLNPLPEEEAWSLFCTRAFRGVYRGNCPKELLGPSGSILKKCGGLPLAIASIASLLSKKEKLVSEWKKVHDSLAAEMKSNPNLEDIEKILLLSYKDLQYNLKCCFLYLSIFPEDYLIKRMKLVRLWVAERFVEEKPGQALEEVAEGYLNELVSRNMIQVVASDCFYRVKTCRVHDIMREIIQMKSQDESFVAILNDGKLSTGESIRILAIHGGDSTVMTWHPNLRSLFMFAWPGNEILKNFKLIRVLELEGLPLKKFPHVISEMVLLRYLSIRRTMIAELPKWIGKRKNLEMLDLKFTLVSSVPEGILKMKNLSQLRGYRYYHGSSYVFPSTCGISVPEGIGRLRKLEKLGNIEVSGNGKIVKDFGNLIQLRRLGILGLTRENGTELCYSLEKLKHLTALYMISISPTEPLDLDSLSSPPWFLRRLYLNCSLASLPNWITSLNCLGKLVLQYSNLENDPLRDLQVLPNLIHLELKEAYAGEELSCDAGGYPRLRKLVFKGLGKLKRVHLEHGAMPGLMGLDIVSCWEMETVPSGIEHLRALQDLWCFDVSAKFRLKVDQSSGEDYWRVEHIRTVKVLGFAFQTE